jgi:hypothetical protein
VEFVITYLTFYQVINIFGATNISFSSPHESRRLGMGSTGSMLDHMVVSLDFKGKLARVNPKFMRHSFHRKPQPVTLFIIILFLLE